MAVGLLTSTVVAFGLEIPGIAVAMVFAKISVVHVVEWSALATLVTFLVTPIGMRATRGAYRPFRAWLDRDSSDPVGSWNAVMAFPIRCGVVVTAFQFAGQMLFVMPFAVRWCRFDVGDTLLIAAGTAVLSVVGGLTFSNGLHVVLRPCLDEVATLVPAVTRPAQRSLDIGARLNLGLAAMSAVSPIAVAAVVLGPRATMRDYLLALAGSLVMTAYLVAVFDTGLARPTVRSLRELLAGIDRLSRRDYSTPVPVTSVDEFGDLAVAFNEMQTGLREREALREAFGSYVDPSLAERLLRQDDSVFEGEEVEVSVLFVDVRDFTPFSLQAGPRAAVQRLNELFDTIVPVITAHGGHANHYLGDGMLAVFGTPSPLASHADQAVAAAIEVQERVHEVFGGRLEIGIGLNSGPVIAGTIGGGGRLEFTVIGDTVNVASRLEQMTKVTGDLILATQATIDALYGGVPTADRGEVEIRGSSSHRLHAIDPIARAARAAAVARG